MRFLMRVYAVNGFQEIRLPELMDSDYSIILSRERLGLEADCVVRFEVLYGQWKIYADKGYQLLNQEGTRIEEAKLNDGLVISVQVGSEIVSLIVSQIMNRLTGFTKYSIADLQQITIGKQKDCDIVYDLRGLVSKTHAVLHRQDNGMLLEDNSVNGIFVDGVRVQGRMLLRWGQIADILGLKVAYMGDYLGVYTPNADAVQVNRRLKPYIQPEPEEAEPAETAEKNLFKRAPRAITELNHEPVEIETPPALNKPQRPPLLMTIGPSFTMMLPMLMGSGLALYSAMSTGRNAGAYMYTGIVTAIASALIGVMWALLNLRYSKKNEKKQETQRFERYWDYLAGITEELKRQYRQNTQILNERYPSAEDCTDYGDDPQTLWSRNNTHADFLFVRLGMGNMPFQVPIQVPKKRFTLVDDELAEKPQQIKDNYSTLVGVPVGINFSEQSVWGVYGTNGQKELVEIVRAMAIQIAANNCYTDVKMVFLYDEKYEQGMTFAKWLPHTWSEDRKVRYVASSRQSVSEVMYALGNVLRIRGERNQKGKILPQYIVFVLNPSLIEGEPAAKYLLEPTDGLGIASVIVAEDYAQLPNTCTHFIQSDSDFSGVYDVTSPDARKQAIQFDGVSAARAEMFARRLSSIRVNEAESGGELVNSISFFDMHQIQKLDEISVQERWRKNRTYDNIRALVGKKAGGANLYLDIHEKYHGPHGLVAGTTGSGKSETLQTFMLSLAMNYSPQDIGFLVIDYKGGGMANLFSGLPHMLGQITNLSGNQVRRAMVSIKSEIKRRQRIFSEYDVNHLDQYTRLVKNGEASMPIPHMIIIVDEFAELKREEPDFLRELISVAQVGRSLGIHLILATQKPAGTVDDNIWSNSKFRLCLRVQDRQDSMDMIRRPDAAYITQAGRCYLQVGNDEIFELFQSGWSGAVYDEDNAAGRSDIAMMISSTGQRCLIGKRSLLKRKETKRRNWINEVIECVDEAAGQNRIPLENVVENENSAIQVIQSVFENLEKKGHDYAPSQYNTRRLIEFLSLLCEAREAHAGSSRAETVNEIIRSAEQKGIKLPEEKEKTQLDAVVEYLAVKAEQLDMNVNLRLWLPILPDKLCLSELPGFDKGCFDGAWQSVDLSHGWSVRVGVGLADDPVNQAQPVLDVDFARDGHLAVCGMVVSGKSTFVQTLLFTLCRHYSPDAVNFYILDYSSRMLGSFAAAKHCGGVAFEDQAERTGKLFTLLGKELERRKKLFEGGNYAQYVRANGLKEPMILVVVDGVANFREKTEDRYGEILITLSREGTNYGIYLLLTGGGFGAADIPNRIAENIKTVICLQMGDKMKYADCLRTRVDVLPEAEVTGRGLAMVHGTPLEFQTCLCVDAEDDYKRNEWLTGQIEQMNQAYTGAGARRIPEIPENPTWDSIRACAEYQEMIQKPEYLPFAYDEEDASIYAIDLRRVFTVLLGGRSRSGKTNTLHALLRAALEKGGVTAVIDVNNGEMASAARRAGVTCVTNREEMVNFFVKFHEEMARRNGLKKKLKSEGADDNTKFAQMCQYPAWYVFIDDIAEMLKVMYNEKDGMQKIALGVENCFAKGEWHNMYFFCTVKTEDHGNCVSYPAYNTIASRKTGLLLGGDALNQRFFDFSALPYKEQTKRYKPGIGLTSMDANDPEAIRKLVIPLIKP